MVKNKIASLEAQIILLKKAVKPRLDFNVDEINWSKIKKEAKKAGQKFTREFMDKPSAFVDSSFFSAALLSSSE
ncbi:MAG: hypothetical protein Q7K26_03025 [bacterium]|nr:hypothetical protein [bacterium]